MRNNIRLEAVNPQWARQYQHDRNTLPLVEVMAGSEKVVWWLSEECGHEWSATVSKRLASSAACWVCSGKRILAGVNDLGTLHAHVARDWHPTLNGDLSPSNLSPSSASRAHWRGQCGHTWECSISSRTIGGHGCPVCAGRQVLTGFNDLLTRYPLVAAEWHPEKNGARCPETTLHGTHKRAWWQCSRGHQWEASVVQRTRPNSRTGKGQGCPYCSGRLAIVGENDIGTTHPEVASRWHPLLNGNKLPEQFKAGSQAKVWWLGKCKHEWKAKIQHRAQFGSGCPYCSGNKVLVGFNDLWTTHPDVAEEWHPIRNKKSPFEVTRGHKGLVWWVCPVGHEYRCTPNNRTSPSNESGCPDCAAAAMSEGTSAVEKAVFEAISSAFPDAVHGARVDRTLPGRRSWALDVFVPSVGLVVEYDGQPWHCSCCSPWDLGVGVLEARDRAKTLNLQELGYRVVRIRTPHMGVVTADDLLVDRRDLGPVVAAALLEHLVRIGVAPESVAA